MYRALQIALVVLVVGAAGIAQAQCCGQAAAVTTAYYAPTWAPSTTASVVTGSPMPTAVTSYYPTTATAYYAPEAVTAYYAAPVTAYYAPTPVTTYYAPAVTTAYYAPAVYAPGVYTSYYGGYRVPGQPIRNMFRRW